MLDLVHDLRFLKCAILVADHGSFRRAADALDLSQSTVSRRVQALERRLGSSIFVRDRRGVRLTHAGQRFVRDATIGAEHLSQAVMDLKRAGSDPEGELRVGVTAPLGSGFLAELFHRFRCECPNVNVIVEDGSSERVSAGVLSGRLDIGFVAGVADEPFVVRSLWKEPIFLAVTGGHRLGDRQRVQWEDMRGERLLIGSDGQGSAVYQYITERLPQIGFVPDVVFQKVGCESLLSMVARGFGVTLTTQVAPANACIGMTLVPIGDESDAITYSAIWMETTTSASVATLVRLSEETARARTPQQLNGIGEE